MQNFPKISIMLLVASFFFACNKENIQNPINNKEVVSSVYEEGTLTNENPTAASERGNCGSIAVSVEYTGKIEYEFDVAFSGFTTVHFFNNPSGTVKTRDDLPLVVQARQITLQNKPTVKQNPKCPWISAGTGVVLIKVFTAQKNDKGVWEQVKGTTAIYYSLGEGKPSQVLMGGTRVFCVDKPIGKWYLCSFSKP